MPHPQVTLISAKKVSVEALYLLWGLFPRSVLSPPHEEGGFEACSNILKLGSLSQVRSLLSADGEVFLYCLAHIVIITATASGLVGPQLAPEESSH